jgi:hypothetical protein
MESSIARPRIPSPSMPRNESSHPPPAALSAYRSAAHVAACWAQLVTSLRAACCAAQKTCACCACLAVCAPRERACSDAARLLRAHARRARACALMLRARRRLVTFKTVVPATRAAAWAFAANFEHIGAWDPGVKASKKARRPWQRRCLLRCRKRRATNAAPHAAAAVRGRHGRGHGVRAGHALQELGEHHEVRAPLVAVCAACARTVHCVACSLCCTGRAPRALQVHRDHLGSAQQGAPACAAAGPGRSCTACGASCEPLAFALPLRSSSSPATAPAWLPRTLSSFRTRPTTRPLSSTPQVHIALLALRSLALHALALPSATLTRDRYGRHPAEGLSVAVHVSGRG